MIPTARLSSIYLMFFSTSFDFLDANIYYKKNFGMIFQIGWFITKFSKILICITVQISIWKDVAFGLLCVRKSKSEIEIRNFFFLRFLLIILFFVHLTITFLDFFRLFCTFEMYILGRRKTFGLIYQQPLEFIIVTCAALREDKTKRTFGLFNNCPTF